MSTSESESQPYRANQELASVAAPTVIIAAETPGNPPLRKKGWRKRSVIFAGVVGALVVASAATGIAASARVVTVGSQSAGSSSSAGGSSASTLVPGWHGRTFGGGSSFGSGATSSGTSSTTSAASATQSSGVVLIDTTLKYQQAEAAGTGIILTAQGEILTNNHVVNGATSIKVTIASTGKTYTADVVGTDPTSDIAVLQLEGASGLTPAKLATATVTVGDSVIAVGNAGGTGSLSAASGMVAAVNQAITASDESGSAAENLTGLIETDADVVAGDSGGPLYSSTGQVIGIDTAASSGSTTVTGYAIPIGSALSVAREIESGSDTASITLGYPAFLGIELADSTAGATSAPTVAGVIAGTPAATIGLAEGDAIMAVDGTAITSAAELTQLLGSHSPGDSVSITWTDTVGTSHSATAVLIKGPAN